MNKKYQAAVELIDQWLEFYRYKKEIPSISIGITHKDKVIHTKSFGFANLAKKKKATSKTLYRIASNSKMFTAIAILQLVAKKKIHLDEDIREHIQSKVIKSGLKNKITFRQLLSHSSGMARDGFSPYWEDEGFPDNNEFEKFFKDGQKLSESAEIFKYSNSGYGLLGLVLEDITNENYDDYIQKNILDKLSLKSTYSDFSSKISDKIAIGYTRKLPEKNRKPFKHFKTNALRAATGFVSNIEDLTKLIIAIANKNKKILPPELWKEMQRVQWFETGEDSKWGLGVEVWKNGEDYIKGHGGGFQGYITRTSFNPKTNLGVVVLTNSIDASAGFITNMTHKILNKIDSDFKTKKPKSDIKALEGIYSSIWGDSGIKFILGNMIAYGFEDPSDYSKHKEIKKNEFKILDDSMYGHREEIVKFNMKDDKVESITLGASKSIPFDRFLKNFKKNQVVLPGSK